jgi:hypothetical protein
MDSRCGRVLRRAVEGQTGAWLRSAVLRLSSGIGVQGGRHGGGSVPRGVVVVVVAMRPCVAFTGAGATTFVAPRCGADGTAQRGLQGRAASAAPIRGKAEGFAVVPWLCLNLEVD